MHWLGTLEAGVQDSESFGCILWMDPSQIHPYERYVKNSYSSYEKHIILFVFLRAFSEETPGQLINQFPFEMVLTVKDLLAIICRRLTNTDRHLDPTTLTSEPKWLPTTFNLQTELAEFVSFYQHREAR